MTTERLLTLAVRWLLLAFAVWAAAAIIPGIHLEGLQSTLAVALILGLLNLYLRPILVFFSIPVTVLTLGFFILVINAALLGLTSWIASWFDAVHFHVDGFGAALLGAIIISLVSLLLRSLIKPDRLSRTLTGGY